jgi:alanine-glyoxylate transaminase/serine-glyoxylate transaminase/serine-pyruvate transaminase
MNNEVIGEPFIPQRTLLGPGPSNVNPRVLQAMLSPLLGYLDPDFLKLMDDVSSMLRQVFRTKNPLTFAVSGTGSAGMESGFCNLLEPDDVVVIAVNGFFGARMADIASRQGAQVFRVDSPWGQPIDTDSLRKEMRNHQSVKMLAAVHAETSTGVLQPLEEIATIAKEHDSLLLVDAVTSLGGSDLNIDEIGIDFCFSATQKCLGAPPGLSPVTASDRAVSAMLNRSSPSRSWYLDLSLLFDYWANNRRYHHTAPMSMIYGLREALRMILEEGLDIRLARHARNASALCAGLEALELKFVVEPEYRLNQLTSVYIPEGVVDTDVRRSLLYDYGIEIGGGLGEFAGKVWRFGLMGESSKEINVLALLSALETVLPLNGYEVGPGMAVQAASISLANNRLL